MRIGILGLGSIGQRHARNILEMGVHEVLGCDVRIGIDDWTTELPIQAVNNPQFIWSWQPDVALICTPPALHYDLAITAIRNEAHVFIEKPIACTSEEADVLRWDAENRKVQLAVGYQLRFHNLGIEPHQYDQRLSIVHAQNMRTWPSQYKKDVLDEFSHEIDIACYLNGPAGRVVARMRDDGLRWNIELEHLHSDSQIQLFAGDTPFARWIDCNKFANKPGVGSWTFNLAENDQAYKNELLAFLNACEYGHWDDRLCSGAAAAHVVRVIEACRESAEQFEVVKL